MGLRACYGPMNRDGWVPRVARSEWGIKRICQSCSVRYYDFLKSPPVCPACEAVYDPEALLKSRRARPIPVETKPKKIPLAVLEGLGVDIADDTVALELADDVPAADGVDDADVDVDVDEEEDSEAVLELAGGDTDDLSEVLVIEDE